MCISWNNKKCFKKLELDCTRSHRSLKIAISRLSWKSAISDGTGYRLDVRSLIPSRNIGF